MSRLRLCVFSFILFAMPLPSFGQRVTTVLPNSIYAGAIAVNPVTNTIYVVDQIHNQLLIIDGATNQTSTVNIGQGSVDIALNTVTNKIYVVNARDNSISVVDGATLSASTVQVGLGPNAVAVNESTNRIYVANSDDNTVTVINGATLGIIATVPVDEGPLAVAANPVTNKIYVGNQRFIGGSSVTVIDGASNATTTIDLGFAANFYTRGQSLLVNSGNNQIYALGEPYLYDIDGATNTVAPIEWPEFSCVTRIALNTSTGHVYGPCADNLFDYDPSTETINNPGAGEQYNDFISVDSSRNIVYLGSSYDFTFTAFDPVRQTVVSFVLTDGEPVNLLGVSALATNSVTGLSYAGSSQIAVVTPAMPLQFVAATPCRLVDTRSGNGAFQGPMNFDLLAANCNLPATAAAYSLNVTLVPFNDGPVGYLTIWPADQFQPASSTMNSLDGRVKANAAIVPAGTLGQVSVYVSNLADVVIDTDGYFAPASAQTYQFYPLAPCRVIDTRNNNSDLGGPALAGGAERDFPVLGSSCIPQDANAAAYSFNFTVVPSPANQPLGYLTVWPLGGSQPAVSTLNNPTATVVANAAIVPAGTNGSISVFASNSTNLVVDINGYFAPAAQGGLSLYPMSPCRVLDTRSNGGQPFSGELQPPANMTLCLTPPAAQAYVLNATVVPSGALGFLTLWPDGQDQPVVSSLNALDGAVTSNMAIVPSTNSLVDAYASNLTQLVLDLSSYFAP